MRALYDSEVDRLADVRLDRSAQEVRRLRPPHRAERVMKVDLARLAAIMPPMPRRKTGRPPGRPKGSVGEPRELLTLRLRPDQREALERIAERERAERGGKRLDLSSIVRRAVDAWLKHRKA